MELHESLNALSQRLGLEVFDDHDSFRGALDDFLDEESATTGDINLLVDAVRLGAFAAMTSMLDSGASVPAAIEEAGSRLARDRGGADVAGAQWACAMLAFAIGRAGDPELRRYRTQQPTVEEVSQPLPPTDLRETSPVPPRESVPQPGVGKRKARVTIVAAALAVAVVAAGTVAVLALRGDDGGDGDSPTDGDRARASELSMDMDSVQERYAGLADDVTIGVDECEPSDADDRVTEMLTCSFTNGVLTLTTFETVEDLERHRSGNTDTDPGSRLSTTDAGTIYSLEKSAVSDVEASSLYWDSTDALQAGVYVAGSKHVELDELVGLYRDIAGSVPYPTKPEDAGLIALAQDFLDLDDCERIQVLDRGELEESLCFSTDDVYIYMGVFETIEDFEAFRRGREDRATGPRGAKVWFESGEDDPQGTLATYVADGTAVRYWDRTECQCYLEASLPSGDEDALESWWAGPVA